MSRKRPAPDTSPPFQIPTQAQSYAAHGSDLSNDQFLQWSENLKTDTQPNVPYSDPSMLASAGYPATPNMASSQQLVRTPSNQLVARGRTQHDLQGAQWVQGPNINNGNTQQAPADKDDLPLLQARALEAKKEAQAKRKQIPPFVQKLSSFLDQSKNTELIRWSDDGKSFIVLDEDEFAKTLIPELFKHNNYASFVRQLNMYGFHKKVGLADNSMRASERKNKSPSEYSHDFFRRGHPELLWAIQKPKNSGPGTKGKGRGSRGELEGDGDDNNDDYIEEIPNGVHAPRPRLAIEGGGLPASPNGQQLAQMVQNELRIIRAQQAAIARTISELRQEHQTLASQAMTFQEQHTRHENSINAILTFLATVYDRSLREGGANLNNLFGTSNPQDTNQGNVVDVDDYSFDQDPSNSNMQRPFKRQPLLLQAAPPVSGVQSGRAATISPSMGSSPYERRPPKKSSQSLRSSQSHTPGTVEEIYEPNMPIQQETNNQLPQSDIMSVIQNVNARNSVPGGSPSDLPTMLNSLETASGSIPLTDSQRANMLRMINNTGNQGGSANNALISPNPPEMPANFENRLADTRMDIDRLARMQAEQDESVQNLEKLLQPLSPNGNIPGIAGDQEVQIPPGLDLDEIFKTSDYFNGADTGLYDSKPAQPDPSIAYDPNAYADDELFGNGDTSGFGSTQDAEAQPFGLYNNDEDQGGHVGGRVESVASSEPSTPANTFDADVYQSKNGGANLGLGEGDAFRPTKKRRNNS
ncbi:putative heat shock transcription factor [Phaeomoniella chlamydospora]|uniref:Putative heat shock transcription factor n=1 Tax=Phaeomoniella chlamydospora TaxID=158046 RepID=A0A0G2H1E4_PHACM|nr:putative heat shock transcription factor [Phaeomoniella chlamydospora]